MKAATMALALTVGLTACMGEAANQGIEVGELPILTEAGAVQASFHVGPWANGEQSVWLRLTGVDGLVGSYQGRIQFDAGQVQLIRTTMTDEDGGGDFGIVNDAEANGGLLQFAGFAIEGFEVRDIAELRFSTGRPLVAGDLQLTLDVVGTEVGSPVATEDVAVAATLQPVAKLELGR